MYGATEIDGRKVVDHYCGSEYKTTKGAAKNIEYATCGHPQSRHKGKAIATDECYIDPATGQPVLKAKVVPNEGKCKDCGCTYFSVEGYILEDGMYVNEGWVRECMKCGKHFSRIPPAGVINNRERWKPSDQYERYFCDECHDEGIKEQEALAERANKLVTELDDIASKMISEEKWGGISVGIQNDECLTIENDEGCYEEVSIGDAIDALYGSF